MEAQEIVEKQVAFKEPGRAPKMIACGKCGIAAALRSYTGTVTYANHDITTTGLPAYICAEGHRTHLAVWCGVHNLRECHESIPLLSLKGKWAYDATVNFVPSRTA